MKKVEEKILESKCFKCSGTGKINSLESCDVCQGTGIYKESFYHFIDEKNKIAIDGDTLK